jgi:hypothetical protein
MLPAVGGQSMTPENAFPAIDKADDDFIGKGAVLSPIEFRNQS